MVTLRLLDLPDELLVTIFSSLPVRSMIACEASCHRLRAVIKGSMLLRWRKWSAERGIQELFPSGLSLPDSFANVQQWEDDWLRFGDENEVTMRSMFKRSQGSSGSPCPTHSDFFLRSGYLIQIHQKENVGWSHIHLSPLRESIKEVWTDVRLGDHLTMEGWAMDLDQDLVAASILFTGVPVGRLEIYLNHFTTGKRHESANLSAVQLDFPGKYDRPFGTHIEIMGNYLIILIAHGTFWHKYQTLYLVDWIKGHVIYQQRSSANTYFPVLTSISEDTFVLGLTRDWALALCRITKEGDALILCTLCKLKLPAVWCNTHLQLKNFNRAPSGPDSPSVPKRYSTLPFRNSPLESLLSFYVGADRGWRDTTTILFFYVHSSDLRTLAKRAVTAQISGMRGLYHRFARWTSLTPKTQPVTMLWKNWGPKTTRWIEIEDGLGSVHQSLSGMRCAISRGEGKEGQLLDFNSRRVRMLAEEKVSGWEDSRKQLVNSQSTISAGKYFKHNIVSHLSYFEVRRSGDKGQLLIDDQWVVQTWNDLNWFETLVYNLPSRHTIRVHSIEETRSKECR